jgi:hypothetical protein
MAIEILIGTGSALLATLLAFLFTTSWRSQIGPWIADQLYRGLRVEGSWELEESFDKDGESRYSQHETLELRQKATKLTGRLTLIDREQSVPVRTLDVSGFVQDRFVVLNCTPATRQDIGYVVYLGEIVGDGKLRGSCAYYHISDSKIETVVATYKRRTI